MDRTLTDGSPVPVDNSHVKLKPNGQQEGYVVLSADERAKGFVEPVRQSYVHAKCGTLTTMGRSLAETYARDPHFYTGTFCAGCRNHFPVGDDGEFYWDNTNQKVGMVRGSDHKEPFDISAWLASWNTCTPAAKQRSE
jgi:hypothetical protein